MNERKKKDLQEKKGDVGVGICVYEERSDE